MRIATWNVNSLRARLDFVTTWLAEVQPDICCLQETKMADATFPEGAFLELGYKATHHGNGQWNGVAIVSKVGLDDARGGFIDDEPDSIDECRIVSALCADIRVFCVYVPNGRTVDSEHYVNKLKWLARLRHELDATCSPDAKVVVCGDFNVAPEDRDVWDITKFEGMTHVTEPERAAFRSIVDWGLVDSLREMHPDETGPFSWWDYRAGSFHRGWGMRIDHILASNALAVHLTAAYVDREARKKGSGDNVRQPSDHAPVIAEITL